MAQSLVRLTLESTQYERNLKNAQKQLSDFTQAIGINMKSLSGMALASGAVTTALKVAKDAFKQSRDMVDEWGRTMQSAESIYSGFLTALNTGDFSGFLTNMSRITQAAREAYDAVSDLELFNAFNGPNLQGARTNLTDSIADFRAGTGSKEGVQAAGDALKAELEKRRIAEENAYRKEISDEAAKIGLDSNKLYGLLTGSYQNFWDTWQDYNPRNFSKQVVKPMFGGATVAGAMSGVNFSTRVGKAPGTDEELLSYFAANVTPERLKELQQYSVKAQQTANEIASNDKMIARLLNGNGGKTTGGGGGGNGVTYAPDSIAAQEALVSELTKKWREAGASVRDSYLPIIAKAKSDLEGMMMGPQKMLYSEDWSKANLGEIAGGVPAIGKGLTVLPEQLSPLQQLNKELERLKDLLEYAPNTQAYQEGLQAVIDKEKEIAKFKGETKTEDIAKDTEDAWKGAASAMASVGSAMASIEDPTAKTVGIVMQAIATVSQAFSQALSEDKTTTGNIWAFIAAAMASTASMVSVISSIHSATGYAQGGIVDGRSYSGDNIPIMANAGEVVLTRAMASNLASQLEGNGLNNLNLTASVSAEQIRFVLNSNGRRTGRGEFVQTNSK